MLNFLFGYFLDPQKKDGVRATYGKEPYRSPDDVSQDERVLAILEGTTKYLLRDVVGIQELQKLPTALLPTKFKGELPTTAQQVIQYVKNNGLPKGFGDWSVQVAEQNNKWLLRVADDRGPTEIGSYNSQRDAELGALFLYRHAIEPYIHGQINKF